jgi:hypothetical protein
MSEMRECVRECVRTHFNVRNGILEETDGIWEPGDKFFALSSIHDGEKFLAGLQCVLRWERAVQRLTARRANREHVQVGYQVRVRSGKERIEAGTPHQQRPRWCSFQVPVPDMGAH